MKREIILISYHIYIQVYAEKRGNVPGQFLLTGSQSFLLNEKISQSLAGRVLELLPLSYQEISREFSVEIDISSKVVILNYIQIMFNENLRRNSFQTTFKLIWKEMSGKLQTLQISICFKLLFSYVREESDRL
ncbi:MAG: hypothetical protein IJT36_02845 [Alphaproteobacteria bacterium]|nr:hypothetical protein [Alphaproteobacteria bacterium]